MTKEADPAAESAPPRRRKQIDFSEDSWRKLQEAATALGCTTDAEAFRRAINLLHLAAVPPDGSPPRPLYYKDDDGTLVRLVLL